MAISAAAVIAFGIAVPGDVRLLAAGIYAFGATLAIAIAHLSVVKLRWSQPDRERPFRVPFEVAVRGRALPVPAIAGSVLMLLLWLTVLTLHGNARWVGGGWMLFGLVAYVVYRRFVERTSLTKRVSVPEQALRKEVHGRSTRTSWCRCSERGLPTTSSARRGASMPRRTGRSRPGWRSSTCWSCRSRSRSTAPLPPEQLTRATAALERAQEVAEEYETVEVRTDLVRARSVGAGIVAEARKRDAELIVMGGEPPTGVRGGAVLGGIGGSRPPEVGQVTEYVLRKAPCRVLLTAPPEAPRAESVPAAG